MTTKKETKKTTAKEEEVMPTPFDKKDEAPETKAPANEETAAGVDYSKYASMAETPVATERRQFDFLSVSGGVETEVIEKDGEEVEKRKPASAYKLFLTRPRTSDDRFESETLELPLSVVPIKYRMVMEQRGGNQGEILVLKSSEFNGKMSDLVTISRFSPDGKVEAKFGPMTVGDARQQFKNAEGKGVLRDKAHVYAMHNGEVVRFVVKGAGLWENRPGLVNGKTEASRTEHPYLSEYLSTFAANDPYFLYEMNVNAAYRDHGTVKFYRPIFERGARIDVATEATVLATLEDLHEYFQEQDKATAEFVPSASAPVAPAEEAAEGEMEIDENGVPKF